MSKKHYVRLARHLGISLAFMSDQESNGFWVAVEDMMIIMKDQNPNFSRDRFVKAINDQAALTQDQVRKDDHG